MADYIIKDTTLTDIANAIREKGGTTDVIATEDMAAAIAAIEAGGGNVQYFTLPIGRSRGDVNGDGRITAADRNMALAHVGGTSPISDAIALWCADTNGTNAVTSDDVLQLSYYLGGDNSTLLTIPTFADYFGNWTYHKIDNSSGYFYVDVPVEGVTADTTATLLVPAHAENIIDVVFSNGTVRVCATVCPGEEMQCGLAFGETDATLYSAPLPETQKSLFDAQVTNNKSTPVYYFSKNHKIGTRIEQNNRLVDSLEANDVYAIMLNSAVATRPTVNAGSGWILYACGDLSEIYFYDDSSPTDVYDSVWLFRIDPTADNTIVIK